MVFGGGGWVVWFWGFPVGWDDWVLMVVGGRLERGGLGGVDGPAGGGVV